MSRFTNKLCPVCEKRFGEKDDIVVCPECGTPHHRECYAKNNSCGLVTYHVEGFEWNGQIYSSLSAVARMITGTNRNGFTFFGIKDKLND